jgi:hypothetical protein
MACYGEWAERSKVSAIIERNQAEGDDDKENSFLMDVPAEEERGVGAEGGSCDKVGPCRTEE